MKRSQILVSKLSVRDHYTSSAIFVLHILTKLPYDVFSDKLPLVAYASGHFDLRIMVSAYEESGWIDAAKQGKRDENFLRNLRGSLTLNVLVAGAPGSSAVLSLLDLGGTACLISRRFLDSPTYGLSFLYEFFTSPSFLRKFSSTLFRKTDFIPIPNLPYGNDNQSGKCTDDVEKLNYFWKAMSLLYRKKLDQVNKINPFTSAAGLSDSDDDELEEDDMRIEEMAAINWAPLEERFNKLKIEMEEFYDQKRDNIEG